MIKPKAQRHCNPAPQWRVWACALAVLSLSACSNLAPSTSSLTQHNLGDWELVTVPPLPIAQLVRIRPDGVLAIGDTTIGYFATRADYRDYQLRFEWRWSGKAGNAGALLHIASGPKDRAWPLSLQVQTKHGSAGDILPMAGAQFLEPLTSAPGAATPIKAHLAPNSEKAVGEWNLCEVISRDGSIQVWINGVFQNKVTQALPAHGRIGFQLEGVAHELRNVQIRPN